MTSGGNEPVQDRYRDGLSVFAYFLRQQLARTDARYVSVDVLFPAVRSLVVANATQTPHQGAFAGTGHEGGQLVLVNQQATTETMVAAPVFVPPIPLDPDPRPEAPSWWTAGIAGSLLVVGVGGLVWLGTRRRRLGPPPSPEFVAFRRQAYQGLWNRMEKLHTDLRRGSIPPGSVVERVGEVNAFVLQHGVHIDQDDAALVDRYLKALVALKQAAAAAGTEAEADLATTGSFSIDVVNQAPELARLDEEARALREELREKVKSLYA